MEHHPRALSTLSQSNRIGFHSNIPVSELIKHVTRAIEASDVALTPPVAKNYGRGDIHKMNRPLTESPPHVGARGRPDQR